MKVNAKIALEGGFPSKFQKNVVREITKKIKSKAERIRVTITDQVRKAVRDSLISTPEYQSIISGKLRAEL